jgi:hypothetical protein
MYLFTYHSHLLSLFPAVSCFLQVTRYSTQHDQTRSVLVASVSPLVANPPTHSLSLHSLRSPPPPPSTMHNPPEDIIQYKRNRSLYKEHLKRVRGQNALIDSSVPKSLGLKHLQTRAKKKQLMEDRSQLVAKDNKLLMERMTSVSFFALLTYSFSHLSFSPLIISPCVR